jgi:hypothetical protein
MSGTDCVLFGVVVTYRMHYSNKVWHRDAQGRRDL